MSLQEHGIAHSEMAEETQRHLLRHVRRGGFPMLAAFDQQCVARVPGIVEERVVAQAFARRVSAVDDDVLRDAQRLRELHTLALPAGHRERRAPVGHRMEIEQKVDAVVKRTQRARAGQVGGLPRAVQHFGGPQPVEILVDAPRPERIGPVEGLIGVDVREAHRKRAARRPEVLGEQPVERDGPADFVAVRQRLDENVRSGAGSGEGPDVRDAAIAGRPASEIGKRDLDRWRERCHVTPVPALAPALREHSSVDNGRSERQLQGG